MNTKRPVLVTTDGSAHSHRVIPHAALLATALDAPLTLLHVLDAQQNDAERAEADATAELKRLGIRDADVLIESREGREKTSDAILRTAARLNAAVLAIDSRGHGALRHMLHGSVALDILRSAPLPLLVSGPNLELSAPEAAQYRIVATCDGSSASDVLLKELGAMAAESIAVTLVRVHEHEPGGKDDKAAVQTCHDELATARKLLPESLNVEVVVREIPRGAGIDTAIIETAREAGAHAIAMSTHGHSARRHMVMGSVAMNLLGRSPLPLLLARAV